MDTFELIAAERRRLADGLDAIGRDDWQRPSLCAGWSVHVVAAHLNAPWSLSVPAVLVTMVRAGGINQGFDRVARELAGTLDPAACVAGLRAHAESRFTPPGSGPEAPLTDVIVHGVDMLQPLDRSVEVAPEALTVSLAWLARGRAKGFVPRGRVDGLRFEATDLGDDCGTGPSTVEGPAIALCAALCGRREALDLLTGDGAAVLGARL